MRLLKVWRNLTLFMRGGAGECLAIKGLEKGKYLVVVYREVSKNDGFIITAFLTRRKRQFEKRRRIWP